MSQSPAAFVAGAFPGLVLRAPLYYSWRSALRLDLGGVKEAPRRACALFEAAFDARANGFVVAYGWPGQARHLAAVGVPVAAAATTSGWFPNTPDDADGEAPSTTLAVDLVPRSLDYARSFEAIARVDFGGEWSWKVYLVNRRRPLIFHMYDDRGADVVARDIEELRPLHEDFREWILDFDAREMIDRIEQTT